MGSFGQRATRLTPAFLWIARKLQIQRNLLLHIIDRPLDTRRHFLLCRVFPGDLLQQVAGGLNRHHRRAQLMADVPRKLPLPLQQIRHTVGIALHSAGQGAYFVVRIGLRPESRQTALGCGVVFHCGGQRHYGEQDLRGNIARQQVAKPGYQQETDNNTRNGQYFVALELALVLRQHIHPGCLMTHYQAVGVRATEHLEIPLRIVVECLGQ